MSATKKLPVIVKKAEPRFVFVSADRKRYAVTTASDLAYSGVPLDWDGPTEGDDLEYLGETNPDTPLGAPHRKVKTRAIRVWLCIYKLIGTHAAR